MRPDLCLDAGALIAFERGDADMRRVIKAAGERGGRVDVVAGVLAQVWRGGPRQAKLARLLQVDGVSCAPLDEPTARIVGEVCGRSGHIDAADVVDVHVVVHARLHEQTVVTSDPDDLRRIDRRLPLIVI